MRTALDGAAPGGQAGRERGARPGWERGYSLTVCYLCTHDARMGAPRLNVTLTDPIIEWLNAEAERLGISVSELLRRILDRERGA